MENKRILFTAPNVAEYLPAPILSPESGQVLVKLAVSTISSGTERANLTGDLNTNSTKPALEKPKFPRSGGYSSAGIVVQIGEGVTEYAPGDRVAVFWSHHARYVTVPTEKIMKIPEDVPFEEAALWNIASFPLAAIRKCRLEMGESAIVMGQGVLGQMAIMELRAAGALPIIAVDPVPEKREQALLIGADYALDPFDKIFAQQVKEITDGGAKVAIEVTGFGSGLDQVLDCMRPAGRVALLGCTRDSNFSIDYYRKVHGPGITLVGAHIQARPSVNSSPGWWSEPDERKCLLEMYRFGRLKFSTLVGETHSPEDTAKVYKRLAEEKSFPLVQFDWRNEP